MTNTASVPIDAIHLTDIVRLLNTCSHNKRACLAFQFYDGVSLHTLLRKKRRNGIHMSAVRKLGKSVLHSLAFLSKPEVSIFHGDLKPDNILISSSGKSFRTILIDFGLAFQEAQATVLMPLFCFLTDQEKLYIQSRWYRAPEVLLEQLPTAAIDMWSLGAIVLELYFGRHPFRAADSVDQLKLVVEVCGYPSRRFTNRLTASGFEILEKAKEKSTDIVIQRKTTVDIEALAAAGAVSFRDRLEEKLAPSAITK